MSDPRLQYDVPSNRLICCICIEWTDFSDLYVDEDGTTWDMCMACTTLEAIATLTLWMAGRRR